MNGLGGAFGGPCFGGIITQELTWRWVLLINPPIAIVIALIAWRVVTDRQATTKVTKMTAMTLRPGRRDHADGWADRAGLRRRRGGDRELERRRGA